MGLVLSNTTNYLRVVNSLPNGLGSVRFILSIAIITPRIYPHKFVNSSSHELGGVSTECYPADDIVTLLNDRTNLSHRNVRRRVLA